MFKYYPIIYKEIRSKSKVKQWLEEKLGTQEAQDL